MNFIEHPRCNGSLGAPQGQEDSVDALPVLRGHHEEWQSHVVQSFWQPDSEELAMLIAGGCVLLTVAGRTHAPLAVGVCEHRHVSDKDAAQRAVETLVGGLSIAGFAVRVDHKSVPPFAMGRWVHTVDVQPRFVRLGPAC